MKTVFSWIILLLPQALLAQNPFARFKVDRYDSKSGLMNDYFMNVYQSREGFIWVNGYSGYTRFDGKNFVNFSSKNVPLIKADNSNSNFTETADSAMWFPTGSSGLIRYKKGVFKAYMLDQPNLFYVGKIRDHELLLSLGGSTTGNYAVFNTVTGKYSVINRNEMMRVRQLMRNSPDTSIHRWIPQGGTLFYLNNQGNLEQVVYENPPKKEIYVSDVMVDSKGRTWVTTDNGLYYLKGSKLTAFPGMEKSVTVQPNSSLGLIAEDKDHGIWVSSGKGRLQYLPEGSDRFYEFPRQYLNIQTLHCILVDREGNIWLATDRGLFKISKTKLINYAEPEGIENNRVNSVCERADHSFIVTTPTNKVYQLNNGIIKPFPIKEKEVVEQKGATNFYAYTDSKNTQWLCGLDFIYKISGNEQKSYPVKGAVRYACEGMDGKMYFAISFQGIGFINQNNRFEYLKIPGLDFSQIYVSAFKQLKDGTWVITSYRTGVYFVYPDGKVENIEISDDIKGIQVFSFLVDQQEKDVIWFATGKGLVKYKKGKKWFIDNNANIPELSLFAILPDHNGGWWFPCNLGVMYAKKSQIDAFIRNPSNKIEWTLIDEGDGMNNRQCVGARHSMVSSDGRIMVLGIGGLVEINPATLNRNTVEPQVCINEMTADDSVFYQPKALVPPGNHRYTFNYSVLSFNAPEKNNIKFRLVGYDTNWIVSKGDHRAFYTNIPPGTYRFEVMASNNDGVWVKEPAVFVFTVSPFFYQTLWFKIVFIAGMLGIIWLIVRWRTKAARQRNLLLEEEVVRQTIELRNSLENLKSTQAQLVQSEKMASLGELTAGIAHEIQNPLNFINNFSEINKELLSELQQEISKGNYTEVSAIANDVISNEEKINHHGKRADSIVKGMLQHSRTNSGQKEVTDMNVLCDEYLRLAYHGYRAKDKSFNAQFETHFDPLLPKVNVMPQDIGRVILNLINNAFYAVNEKAKNTQSANPESAYSPTVTVSTKSSGDKIEIIISDNGPGIPDAAIKKIFQPFFTTKPTGQGTGLGLSLSYDIVKAHGGDIFVNSIEGEGTRFVIFIPAGKY
jgi:signal transduction histidine kinase/ligand-binding sensor domain-containing protein